MLKSLILLFIHLISLCCPVRFQARPIDSLNRTSNRNNQEYACLALYNRPFSLTGEGGGCQISCTVSQREIQLDIFLCHQKILLIVYSVTLTRSLYSSLPHWFHLSLSLSVCLSLPPSPPCSLYSSLPHWFHLSLSLFRFVSPFLPLLLAHSIPLSLIGFISLSLSFGLSLPSSLSSSLTLFLSPSLVSSLSLSLFRFVSPFLPLLLPLFPLSSVLLCSLFPAQQ